MKHRSSSNKNFWGQGGVALADILANSVAVMLILIVVTLSIQQEKADLELEQNADVTTLLARQIATTVVYNDLPSSPPAVLHDYSSCRIEHDCNPSLYPIIELHQQYVREYNSGLKFFRKELLKPGNPFDQFIQTFTQEEKLNLRIDVYDVNLYYVAIGILKEHKINPRHWHYLGENVKPLVSPEQALAEGGHGKANEKRATLEGDQEPDQQGGGNSSGDNQTLENTEFVDTETLEQLQYSDLLPPTEENESANRSPNSDSSSEQGQNQGGKVKPEILFESLVELFEKEGMLDPSLSQGQSKNRANPNQRGRRSMRMHVPNAKTNSRGSQSKTKIRVAQSDYNRTLLAFFLDQLQLARTQRTTFVQGLETILHQYSQNPQMIEAHPNIALIRKLESQLDEYFVTRPTQYSPLQIKKNHAENELILSANHVGATNTLLVDRENSQWSENLLPKNNQISLILRSFPGLYKGERLDFPQKHLLLVHPNEEQYPTEQWRPIIIVDTWLEDASIGFIKASFHDGQLILDSQSLGTRINETLIPEPRLKDNFKSGLIATTIYGIGSLMLLSLLGISLIIGVALRRQRLKTLGSNS